MPKLLEVSSNVGDFKELEKALKCSDVRYLNACKRVGMEKFRENNSSTYNHQTRSHS